MSFKLQGSKFPIWLQLTIALSIGYLLYATFIYKKPADAQKIDDCISRLNSSASGGLSRQQLEQTCTLMLQRGEL